MRVHILVEGQTEEVIVREVVKPYLQAYDTWITYSILATKRDPSGGKWRGEVSRWSKIEGEIRRLLQDSSLDVLTTMIDYYGVPSDTPGMAQRSTADPYRAVHQVEATMATVVGSDRFRPHLTLHETESWVFAAGETLAERFRRPELSAWAAAAGEPELVDDGPDTAPSKRLVQKCPEYAKVLDGPAIIAAAGLEAILGRCPHARAWLDSLKG
jgi:Domain of unknown function (DUF4276)